MFQMGKVWGQLSLARLIRRAVVAGRLLWVQSPQWEGRQRIVGPKWVCRFGAGVPAVPLAGMLG
jgi:hypothetical protein